MNIEHWHEGKVAIVTGGSNGIGLETARALSRRGAYVAIGARRCADADTADRIRETSGCRLAAGLDVCDQASIDAFMADVHERLGSPSILVNAAGVAFHRSLHDHDDAVWDCTIDTNLTGPFRMTRACVPSMRGKAWGRIVNIASTAATTAEPAYAAYCASKSGLLGLTRVTAREGAAHGISAVAVSPTWVETDMLRASAAETAQQEGLPVEQIMSRLAAANPQNRLVQTREIAELVSFLCSDAAPGLTMEDIQVNAGAHW